MSKTSLPPPVIDIEASAQNILFALDDADAAMYQGKKKREEAKTVPFRRGEIGAGAGP